MASGKDAASHTSDHHGLLGIQSLQKNTSGCHAGEHHTLLYCRMAVLAFHGKFGTILIKFKNV
jgi:hypothetical protein